MLASSDTPMRHTTAFARVQHAPVPTATNQTADVAFREVVEDSKRFVLLGVVHSYGAAAAAARIRIVPAPERASIKHLLVSDLSCHSYLLRAVCRSGSLQECLYRNAAILLAFARGGLETRVCQHAPLDAFNRTSSLVSVSHFRPTNLPRA